MLSVQNTAAALALLAAAADGAPIKGAGVVNFREVVPATPHSVREHSRNLGANMNGPHVSRVSMSDVVEKVEYVDYASGETAVAVAVDVKTESSSDASNSSEPGSGDGSTTDGPEEPVNPESMSKRNTNADQVGYAVFAAVVFGVPFAFFVVDSLLWLCNTRDITESR